MEGYCINCRAKREMEETRNVTLKTGRPAVRGVCTGCHRNMFVIGKRVEEEAASS